MPNRCAVVVGINYTHFPPGTPGEATTRAGMNPLRFAEADARDMARVLQASGYTVASLLGPAATRRAILVALRRQSQLAGADGLLVVHFSGHGQVDPDDPDTAYLLPVDADPQNPVDLAIPLADLAGRFLAGANTAITLLDCCHSGYALGMKGVSDADDRGPKGAAVPADLGREFGRIAQYSFRSVQGRIALSACAGDQLARELDRLQHGAFTYYALDWWDHSRGTDHNSLAAHVARGLEKEHLPALVSGGVTAGLIRLRTVPKAPIDLAWRQAIQPRLARLDERQFHLLCYRLGLSYDQLPGADRPAKTLHLIVHMEHAERTRALSAEAAAAAVRQERDRLLAQRLAALDPVRLPALYRTLYLDNPAAVEDVIDTIHSLIAEIEWQDRFQELEAAAQAALDQQERERTVQREATTAMQEPATQIEATAMLEPATQVETTHPVGVLLTMEEASRRVGEQAAQEEATQEEVTHLDQAQAHLRAHDQTIHEDQTAVAWLAQLNTQQLRELCRIFGIDYYSLPGSDTDARNATLIWMLRGSGRLDALPAALFAVRERVTPSAVAPPPPAQRQQWQTILRNKRVWLLCVLLLVSALMVRNIVFVPDTSAFTLHGHSDAVESAAWSPDGQRIVTASADHTARVWDAASGQSLHTLRGYTNPGISRGEGGHTDSVISAAWSPDGQRIVTASWDETARVWPVTGSQFPVTFYGHTDKVESAAWSPDGQRIVTASADHTAQVWNPNNGQFLRILSGHTDNVISAAWSPNGKTIVTASWDKTARVWDAASGQSLHTLSGHTDRVTSAVWSPDGQRIVTTSWDGTARVWDARDGQSLHTLNGHFGSVYSAAWNPNGQRIVTTSNDSTARIWDTANGQPLHTLSGHSGAVESAAWSPDGQRIVTASADHTARVWDAASGQLRATLTGHTDVVFSAVWSPDGKSIVTTSDDATAKVWHVP